MSQSLFHCLWLSVWSDPANLANNHDDKSSYHARTIPQPIAIAYCRRPTTPHWHSHQVNARSSTPSPDTIYWLSCVSLLIVAISKFNFGESTATTHSHRRESNDKWNNQQVVEGATLVLCERQSEEEILASAKIAIEYRTNVFTQWMAAARYSFVSADDMRLLVNR